MMGKKYKITDSEMLIMKVLWASDKPCTSKEILEKLQYKDWKITTLITLAGKLIDKGAVQSVKIGRTHAHHYTALITEDEYKQMQTRNFLEKIHKGSVRSLFSALFDDQELTPEEVSEIKKFIIERSKEGEE